MKPEPIKYRCRTANLPLECLLYSEHSPLEYLQYSKPSSRILDYIVNIPPGENLIYSKHSPVHSPIGEGLLYSKSSGVLIYYVEGLLYDTWIELGCIGRVSVLVPLVTPVALF